MFADAVDGHNAIDALLEITDAAMENITSKKRQTQYKGKKLITNNRFSLLIQDIASAFNSTDTSRLVDIITKRGFCKQTVALVASFLKNHTITLSFNEQTEQPHPFNSDLPQGSPLSPILFLIYAQVMLEEEEQNLTKGTISYMDNDALSAIGRHFHHMASTLSQKTNTRIERGTQMNLQYKRSKTNLLHFHATRSSPPNLTDSQVVMADGTQIEHTFSARHLVVIIDEHLMFKNHITKTKSRLNQTMGFLYHLRHNAYGLHPIIYRMLIIAKIVPTFLYASPVYWTGKETTIHELQPAYNRALRWATDLPIYTPTRLLYRVIGLPPLQPLLNHYSRMHAIRLANNYSSRLGEEFRTRIARREIKKEG